MDYQVSARKWRPQTFEEVIGQGHVTTSLINAVNRNKLSQAYLFSGIRGTGKTSLARILAKSVNCEKKGESVPCNTCESCREITAGRSVDVVEVDGASNTGVDDVRELREKVKYLPLKGRYKIYIIDEVHMLSNAAFNALLKTLEEPPPHLIFILATTESHKIPQTILSRCQHFTFRRMIVSEILPQLEKVVSAHEVAFTGRGLNLIARAAEGSMRDALSLIDQAISFGGESISDGDVLTLLGRVDGAMFHRLVTAIHDKDAAAALTVAREVIEHGCDLRQFLSDWLEHLRHVIVGQNLPDADLWIDLPKEEVEEICAEAVLFSREAMQRLFSLFTRLSGEIRFSPQPNLLFEVALMKAILLADMQPIEAVIERLDGLVSGNNVQGERLEINKSKPISNPSQSLSKANESSRKTAPPAREKAFQKKETEDKISKVASTGHASQPPEEKQPDSEAPLPGKASWEKLLTTIKQRRPNVGSYLEEGTLIELNAREIRLGFSKNSAFLMSLIQKEETEEWLKGVIKEQLKHALKLVLVENDISEPRNTKRADVQESNRKSPSEASSHPLIQEALRVLGGSIIEVKQVIDE